MKKIKSLQDFENKSKLDNDKLLLVSGGLITKTQRPTGLSAGIEDEWCTDDTAFDLCINF